MFVVRRFHDAGGGKTTLSARSCRLTLLPLSGRGPDFGPESG